MIAYEELSNHLTENLKIADNLEGENSLALNDILELIVLSAIALELFTLYRHTKLEKRIDEHLIDFHNHTKKFEEQVNITDKHILQLDEHIIEINEHLIKLNGQLLEVNKKNEFKDLHL